MLIKRTNNFAVHSHDWQPCGQNDAYYQNSQLFTKNGKWKVKNIMEVLKCLYFIRGNQLKFKREQNCQNPT